MTHLRLVIPLLVTACSTAPQPLLLTSLLARTETGSCRVEDVRGLVFSYRHAGVRFKPYVDRLCSPTGLQILRDAPHDHVHHHALMLAVGLQDDLDFWSEVHTKVAGRQSGTPPRARVVAGPDGQPRARVEQRISWVDNRDDNVVLRESRSIEAEERTDDRPTLLTWRSELTAPAEPEGVRLWGRHYFGLGMRFVAAMDGNGRFLTPLGEVGGAGGVGVVVRGDERLVRADWCAYSADCGGRPVTVAAFDHPDNPRHPATWFTMRKPFAYLSATLALAEEPLRIPPGNALQLTYGVAVWDGTVTAEVIAQTYRRWLAGL